MGPWLGVLIWLGLQAGAAAGAWRARQRGIPLRWGVRAVLGAILVTAAALRFWELGYYPDFIHHDHSIYGGNILRFRDGTWHPFFARVYSVGRPWLLLPAAVTWFTGPTPGILRLTAALSGVLITWGVFHLGRALFSETTALIAAWLAAVNHVLLLFSRQPYVLDPVAPFVLGFCAAVLGVQRASPGHWFLAGLGLGWALLGYWASLGYPAILLACAAYAILRCPSWLSQNRQGLAWCAVGLALSYGPLLIAGDAGPFWRAAGTHLFSDLGGGREHTVFDVSMWAHRLGWAFGLITTYGDVASSWLVSTGQPICLRYDMCLFGAGLVWVLYRRQAAVVLVIWVGVLLLGAAFLGPVFYHVLAAIPPIMLICAAAFEPVSVWMAGVRSMLARALVVALIVMTCGAVGCAHLQTLWQVVQRPTSPDGHTAYTGNINTVIALYVRAYPRHHYFFVRGPDPSGDLPPSSCLLDFFAADSRLDDLSTDLRSTLPELPAPKPEAALAFVVFPSRETDADALSAAYPTAQVVELWHLGGSVKVICVESREANRTERGDRCATAPEL